MQSALSALALASVSRIVEALPAVIAAQSFEKLRYSQNAYAMQPRPCTAVMAPCPRNSDLVRHDLISQFQLDQVAARAHFHDGGPPEQWP
jgi:hypothetical protein